MLTQTIAPENTSVSIPIPSLHNYNAVLDKLQLENNKFVVRTGSLYGRREPYLRSV